MARKSIWSLLCLALLLTLVIGCQPMGKVDQGVVALWVARHHFGKPLRYTGFGGEGKQVRDLLRIAWLSALQAERSGNRLGKDLGGRTRFLGGG